MRYLSRQKTSQEAGFTLIELTVVLLILIALAGLAVPYIQGTSSKAMCDATDVTMQNVKKAIMERYYLDTLGNFPKDKALNDYNLKYLFVRDDELDNNNNGKIDRITNSGADIDIEDAWQPFDPQTQLGWRQGGYLQGGVQLNSNPNSSFQDNTKVHDNIVTGQLQVLDGWSRPIILQVPSNCSAITKTAAKNCARLISAGADATIDTLILGNRKNDDRVLYLEIPAPVNNGTDNTNNTSDDNTTNPPCD